LTVPFCTVDLLIDRSKDDARMHRCTPRQRFRVLGVSVCPAPPPKAGRIAIGRIQNPIACAREWKNAATERQKRIVRVALRRMMVFHSPLWHRHNMHGLQKNLLRFPAVAAQRFAFFAN
jgi:hypothetical protein